MISDKFQATIKKYNLIAKNDRIVVGVSGGPDSVALIYLLHNLSREFKISLHIAHLDHMIRKDSFKDSEFVNNLAVKLKIPVSISWINIKEIVKVKKGSLEEISRNARLGFLLKAARDFKATKIALGHNLDDQAETVLMRVIRGSGLYGLSGILPKRVIHGCQVIRPLVEIRRKEIEAFLKKRKIIPCRDLSNSQDIYFRNKIRNQLLVLLEKEYNRNIKEILSNMAENVGYDYEYLIRVAKRKMSYLKRKVILNKFMRLHPSIQRLVLRLNIAEIKGDTRRITFQHIRELEDLLLNRPVDSVVDLPGNVSVVKRKSYLLFYLRNRKA